MMRGMERKKAKRRPRRRVAQKARPAPAVDAVVVETPALPAGAGPFVAIETPEPLFAARIPPPAQARPRPTTRHAIFFDVENTSHPAHIERVIERIAIDHLGRSTEFYAVGNWRVIGHETARLLARHGAQLVHSAPSTGVRDWSDLRIAVSAGVWLAGAHPGDVIEIVSDDRAFDAVGDVAAALGITFHRLTARTLGSATPAEPAHAAPQDRSRRRGGRRRRHPSRAPAPVVETRRETDGAAPPRHDQPAEAHTAPHDELVEVVRELAERTPNGAVLIDNVARTLKARGFSRPPGSPRLVTRLRRIKELMVSPTGMITLVSGAAAFAPPWRAACANCSDGPSDRAFAGPAPSGGVGGTRQGVKCLHAHYAWHLAGGDDPVGRWVAAQLQRPSERS
jgi:hypothetical protein